MVDRRPKTGARVDINKQQSNQEAGGDSKKYLVGWFGGDELVPKSLMNGYCEANQLKALCGGDSRGRAGCCGSCCDMRGSPPELGMWLSCQAASIVLLIEHGMDMGHGAGGECCAGGCSSFLPHIPWSTDRIEC